MLQNWGFESEVGELKQNDICIVWAERNANNKQMNIVGWISVSLVLAHLKGIY